MNTRIGGKISLGLFMAYLLMIQSCFLLISTSTFLWDKLNIPKKNKIIRHTSEA